MTPLGRGGPTVTFATANRPSYEKDFLDALNTAIAASETRNVPAERALEGARAVRTRTLRRPGLTRGHWIPTEAHTLNVLLLGGHSATSSRTARHEGS